MKEWRKYKCGLNKVACYNQSKYFRCYLLKKKKNFRRIKKMDHTLLAVANSKTAT